MNNKGMTLIELLISIALIGVVVIFLFDLLVDIRHETENNGFAYNNQINRTEIIYKIQDDLRNYTLVGIEDKTIGDILIINFYFKNGDGIISTELRTDKKEKENSLGELDYTYYFKYKDYNGDSYTWQAKGAEIDPCATFTYYNDNNSSSYYFKLNIYLYNKPYHMLNNKDKNNAVDDIEITYMGNKNDLLVNENYLTNYNVSNKEIGACTN